MHAGVYVHMCMHMCMHMHMHMRMHTHTHIHILPLTCFCLSFRAVILNMWVTTPWRLQIRNGTEQIFIIQFIKVAKFSVIK